MRIIYGVFGYGRGHATRAAGILSELSRRHELHILAGGDAHDALFTQYPVTRIPTLGYVYTRRGRCSKYLTLRRNMWHMLDMLFGGPVFQTVLEEGKVHAPANAREECRVGTVSGV